jgi:hypothetical protein
VRDHYDLWSDAMSTGAGSTSGRKTRVDLLRQITASFNEGFNYSELLAFGPTEARALLASYAYEYNFLARSGRSLDFAFNVAFLPLCHLKCTSNDPAGFRMLSSLFYESMVPRRGLLEELKHLSWEENPLDI